MLDGSQIMQSLILVGGNSSRMGSSKYALPLPISNANADTEPLLLRLITCHHQFQLSTSRQTSTVILSVRDSTQRKEVEQMLSSCRLPDDLRLEFVVDKQVDSGPASGLLAAHLFDRHFTWLVTGCDYPMIEPATLQQLFDAHIRKPAVVTCFINDQGFSEPLLAIWTPAALLALEEMVQSAEPTGRKLGPNQAIRRLEKMPAFEHTVTKDDDHSNVCYVKPSNPLWIRNVNTPQDWTDVQAILKVEDDNPP